MSTDIQIDEKVTTNLKVPGLWKVVFLNDDKTPMEFVIDILTKIFRHNEQTARNLTLEVHNSGSAVVGLYTYEIAEQKVVESTNLSRAHGFPLRIQAEEE